MSASIGDDLASVAGVTLTIDWDSSERSAVLVMDNESDSSGFGIEGERHENIGTEIGGAHTEPQDRNVEKQNTD